LTRAQKGLEDALFGKIGKSECGTALMLIDSILQMSDLVWRLKEDSKATEKGKFFLVVVNLVSSVYVHFFPRKITFRRNSAEFLGKTIFQNFFCRKFNFFPTLLGENFPRNFPQKFPRKKCTKNRPLVSRVDVFSYFLVSNDAKILTYSSAPFF
jgi:hypothetical protein